MNSKKQGFIFTVDAFVALILVSLIIFVIVYQLSIPSAFFSQQVQTYDYARDVVGTLSTLTIGDLKSGPDSNIWIPIYPEESEDDHTVIEQIVKEHLNGDAGRRDQLISLLTTGTSPLIPERYGASISVKVGNNWQEIAVPGRDTVPFTRIQSSASYVLMGYATSFTPDEESNFDYPVNSPNADYCAGGGGVMPCADFAFGQDGDDLTYTGGTLLGPTVIRVNIWT